MFLKLRENSLFLERAASWFSEKWDVPLAAYLHSMKECIRQKEKIPQWYIFVDENQKILAGAGVIDNDFHQRSDLTPNLCALFVEEHCRRQGIARKILDFIREDIGRLGLHRLYLLTDHNEFYEKCGWEFLTMVEDEKGSFGRMYTISVPNPESCHKPR